MTYDQFLARNKNKLIGYYLLSKLSMGGDVLEVPYPPTELSDDQIEELKGPLNEDIPKDSMITDLWNWDIHFEEDLGDDWYFETVFGSPTSLGSCAEQLAELFIRKCGECDLDYNQTENDANFETLVREQATQFLLAWRSNIVTRYAKVGAPIAEPMPSDP